MSRLLPTAFLFRYTLPLRHDPSQPRSARGQSGTLALGLTEKHVIPFPSQLDQYDHSAVLRGAWNEAGLGFSVTMPKEPTSQAASVTPPTEPATSQFSWQSVAVWIDTRNTQSIHRASRFCHAFEFFPHDPQTLSGDPRGRQVLIPRAKEDAPLCDPQLLRVAATESDRQPGLEMWIPSEALRGYDPRGNPRLGFYFAIAVRGRPIIPLVVEAEFPFTSDPSLWTTLELLT